MKVLFPGDSRYSSSEYIGLGATIDRTPTDLILSIPRDAHVTLPTKINATLLDSIGNPLAFETVSITITPSHSIPTSFQITTDEDGFASYVYVPPYLGSCTINASFAGNEFYEPTSQSSSIEVLEISLFLSLTLSQVSGHRDDKIIISGDAWFEQNGKMVPAGEGISFELTLEGTPDFNVGTHSIQTDTNGEVRGEWIVSDNFDYGNYTIIATSLSPVFNGSTSFDFRVIFRTSLTIVPLYPTIGITQLDAAYVDLPMGFKFMLVDELNRPVIGYKTQSKIDDGVWTEFTTDSSGSWTIDGLVPSEAGGLCAKGYFGGSPNLDSISGFETLQVQRRPSRSVLTLSSLYLHRGDVVSISATISDGLTEEPAEDSIAYNVFIDGGLFASGLITDGTLNIDLVLPDTLNAGIHKVSIQTMKSRVYSVSNASIQFDAYENSVLTLDLPSNIITDSDYTIKATLTDEDGSPLPDKTIIITVNTPKNEEQSILLQTDSIGRAAHRWSPHTPGSYYFNADFYGEYWFTKDTAYETAAKTEVESGLVETEGGSSPLWILPLLLAIVANCVLEAATFGLVSYMDVTVSLNGASFRVTKISYPIIVIKYITVGLVTVPVPIIVVESSFGVIIDTPDGNHIALGGGGEEGDLSEFNGHDIVDVASQGFDVITTELICSTSTTMSSTEPEIQLPFIIPSAPTLRSSSSDGVTVNIISPKFGDTVAGIVDISCEASSSATIEEAQLLIDGELISTKNNPGNSFTFQWNSTLGTYLGLGFPKYNNGPHNITVSVKDKNETTSSTSILVNLVNSASIISGIAMIGVGIIIIAVLETLVNRLAAPRQNVEPDPISSAFIESVKSALFTALPSIITFLILDALANWGINPLAYPLRISIGPFTLYPGHVLGFILLVLGFLASMYWLLKDVKASDLCKKLFVLIVVNTFFSLIDPIVNEYLLRGGLIGWIGEIFVSLLLSICI